MAQAITSPSREATSVTDPILPLGCDTLVALPAATAEGVTLFGKNSDRYPWECQPLVLLPARTYGRGAKVRCQYIEIPQVRETARILGAQPYWLWGLEHGVNEHGVAIGNEMVATREPMASIGLLGVDVVRLGLERGRSADEAIDVMTGLIETHGQGGSGQPHVNWPYHNGFLVADAHSAWILEASGRHWAARQVADVANITNHLSITTNWERLGAGVVSFALAQGWCCDGEDRFDFAGAYRDRETLPPHVSERRSCRAATLLEAARGRLTGATLRAILRDHYGSPVYRPGRDFGHEEYFSLCMHAGELMSTTASMVVALDARDAPPVAWMALGAPCASVYLPYYFEGELPAVVSLGGKDASPDSPWWRFRELLGRVEGDPDGAGGEVRAYWAALEAEVADRACQVEARAADLRSRGDEAGVARLFTDFMDTNVRAVLHGLEALERLTAQDRVARTAG